MWRKVDIILEERKWKYKLWIVAGCNIGGNSIIGNSAGCSEGFTRAA